MCILQMRKNISLYLLLFFLSILGCSTMTYQDCTVICPNDIVVKKSDNPILPRDFPNSVFRDWACSPHTVSYLDINQDGTLDYVLVAFNRGKDHTALTICEVLSNQGVIARGFVEVKSGTLTKLWVAREASQLTKDWVEDIIRKVNGY